MIGTNCIQPLAMWHVSELDLAIGGASKQGTNLEHGEVHAARGGGPGKIGTRAKQAATVRAGAKGETEELCKFISFSSSRYHRNLSFPVPSRLSSPPQVSRSQRTILHFVTCLL